MNTKKLLKTIEKINHKLDELDPIDVGYELVKRFIALSFVIIIVLEPVAIAKFGEARVIGAMPYPERFLKLLSQTINIFTLSIIATLLILIEYVFRNRKLYEKIEKFIVKVGIVILIKCAAMFVILAGSSILYRIIFN